MIKAITSTVFFGVALTLVAFNLGIHIKNKTKLHIFNPILVAAAIIIIFLTFLKIDYSQYENGAKYVGYLLTPATVSLALPLYEKIEILKSNWKAISLGIIVGLFSSVFSILPLVVFFKLTHQDYVTLLPKSITAAFGMSVSQEMGGIVPVTVVVIILTGMVGSILSERIFKIFKIHHPISKGVALGSSSHALGTARAFELGEIEGAISSLSLAVSGILTVIFISLFTKFY